MLQHPASLLQSHGCGGDTGAATRMAPKGPTGTSQEEEKLMLGPLGRTEMHRGGDGYNRLLLRQAVVIPDTKGFSLIQFNIY